MLQCRSWDVRKSLASFLGVYSMSSVHVAWPRLAHAAVLRVCIWISVSLLSCSCSEARKVEGLRVSWQSAASDCSELPYEQLDKWPIAHVLHCLPLVQSGLPRHAAYVRLPLFIPSCTLYTRPLTSQLMPSGRP
jgi:hypothetical protein